MKYEKKKAVCAGVTAADCRNTAKLYPIFRVKKVRKDSANPKVVEVRVIDTSGPDSVSNAYRFNESWAVLGYINNRTEARRIIEDFNNRFFNLTCIKIDRRSLRWVF